MLFYPYNRFSSRANARHVEKALGGPTPHVQVERSISDASLDASCAERREQPARGRRRTYGIVIPTLDEARSIADAVRDARAREGVADVVVVDGGSQDGTRAKARRAGARVVRSPPGRGVQLDRGARSVRGEVVVFLHADCRLPTDGVEAMDAVLDAGHDAGLFAVIYDAPHPLLRLIGAMSRLRTRWTEFGEGALFVERRRYEALGGFAAWPLFEDVDLLARLRRARTLGRARGRVLASARRFQRRGVVRQLLLNIFLYTLFACGVSPEQLHALYTRRVGARSTRRRAGARAHDDTTHGRGDVAPDRERARANGLRRPHMNLYGSRCLESPPEDAATRRDSP